MQITSCDSRQTDLVHVTESTTNSRATSRADSTDGLGGSRRGSIIDKPKRGRYQSLNLPGHVADILLESEEKERRGSR